MALVNIFHGEFEASRNDNYVTDCMPRSVYKSKDRKETVETVVYVVSNCQN